MTPCSAAGNPSIEEPSDRRCELFRQFETTGDSVSILWNLATGEVLACRSSLHRDQMKLGTEGVQHFTDFAELNAEKSEGFALRIPVG